MGEDDLGRGKEYDATESGFTRWILVRVGELIDIGICEEDVMCYMIGYGFLTR